MKRKGKNKVNIKSKIFLLDYKKEKNERKENRLSESANIRVNGTKFNKFKKFLSNLAFDDFFSYGFYG